MLTIMAVDDELHALRRAETMLADIAGVELVGTFDDPLTALSAVEARRPDILLLDIQMPTMGGLELADYLIQGAGHVPLIIFVTAYEQYAVRAFEAHAVDYLLKPASRTRFAAAIERARTMVGLKRANGQVEELRELLEDLRSNPELPELGDQREIWVQRGLQYHRIVEGQIEWAESERDYVHIHDGRGTYLLRTPLTRLHQRLGEDRFVRLRRSAIARVDSISAIRDRGYGDIRVLMASGAEITVGRTFLKGVRQRLKNADWQPAETQDGHRPPAAC